MCVAFSPAGDRILSGGEDGTVRLWQLDGIPAAAPFEGHQGFVFSVAFAPHGDRIVSGGEDGTVRLWQLDGTPAAAPFKGHNGGL
jgi:WD40 repeat protein